MNFPFSTFTTDMAATGFGLGVVGATAHTEVGVSWRLLIPGTAGAVGNDSCLPLRTLICYCSRAAVQHAAESRWQPGRRG